MNRNGLAKIFALHLLQGRHLPSHEYRLALYRWASNVTTDYTGYHPEGETSGEGYVAGGMRLEGMRFGEHDGGAWWNFDSATWKKATFSARYGLLYNASLPDKAAIAVLELPVAGEEKELVARNAPFVVDFPEPDGQSAIVFLKV